MPSKETPIDGDGEIKSGEFYLNIYPGPDKPISKDFADAAKELQESLKKPVWFLIQNGGEEDWGYITETVTNSFYKNSNAFDRKESIALIIESSGGYARDAYKIARFIRRTCGGYIAVIPSYAKSAATLLTLGAESIILEENAELGPLDTQIFDKDRGEVTSALDEVKSLERLFAAALDALDDTMRLLIRRTRKKPDTLITPALHFISEMMSPMIKNLDAVHYTRVSRFLKISEEYAIRLLRPYYNHDDLYELIAKCLVEMYPEHGFVIDIEEAKNLGLKVTTLTNDQKKIIYEIAKFSDSGTYIGKVCRKEG